jgi:site-specific recombinase XerD
MRDPKSPLAGFIPMFLATTDLAPKSVSDYGRLLKEFDAFTKHVDLESALTMANAKAWQQEKRVDGVNAAINATMYLKSFATWACREGYKCSPEGVSVLFHLKAPKAPKRVRHALTHQQLDAIWTALASPSAPAGPRTRALLRVLLATGMKKQGENATAEGLSS